MKQHKWHKEIKAWADGAEIEQKHVWAYGEEIEKNHVRLNIWSEFNGNWRFDGSCEYRIKPQPKEPKYLYVYLDDNYEFSPIPLIYNNNWQYIGKIKLEDNDGDA